METFVAETRIKMALKSKLPPVDSLPFEIWQ